MTSSGVVAAIARRSSFFLGRLPRWARLTIAVTALFALASGAGGLAFLMTRGGPLFHSPSSPPISADYPAPLLAAADKLELSARYGFFAVQQSLLVAKPGGPLVPRLGPDGQPDPSSKPVESLFTQNMLTRGLVADGGFAAEIRSDYQNNLDWDRADRQFVILATSDGSIFRAVAEGWLLTDKSPGHGIDPFTVRHLPDLLRHLVNPQIDSQEIDHVTYARYTGTADPFDWPGVIASDGIAFTEAPIEVEVWLDPQGRLSRLVGRARNMNETVYDLKVTTDIHFDFDAAVQMPPTPTSDEVVAP